MMTVVDGSISEQTTATQITAARDFPLPRGSVSVVAVAAILMFGSQEVSAQNVACNAVSNGPSAVCDNNQNLTVYSGSFRNDGTFNNNVRYSFGVSNSSSEFNNVGTFNNNGGYAIIENGATFSNNGSFLNKQEGRVIIKGAGSSFNNNQTFSNSETSEVSVFNAGTFNNSGTLNNTAFVTSGQDGTINNTGTFNNNDRGVSVVSKTGVFNNTGTFNNNVGATLSFDRGGTFNNTGTFNNLGGIQANGSVDEGTAIFNNKAGAVFNNTTGSRIDLGGVPAVFNNYGLLNLASSGTSTKITTLNGNYVQTAAGILNIRAIWTANSADRLAVLGTAQLAGKLNVNITDVPKRGGLTNTFTILTATKGITDNGLSVTNTAAVKYDLIKENSGANSQTSGFVDTLKLKATVNFQGRESEGNGSSEGRGTGLASPALSTNQSAVGASLNTIYAHDARLSFMPALMKMPDTASLGAALSQLMPNGAGPSNASELKTSATFGNQLLSCHIRGQQGDENAIIREGQCVWARGTYRSTELRAADGGPASHETSSFVSAGAQIDVGGPWRLGGAIGYEMPHVKTSANSSADGQRAYVGGVVKYNPGPWLVALAATAGHGWYKDNRAVEFTNFTAAADSKSGSSFYSGRFTVSYLAALARFYLKPQVELANTRVTHEAYTESGTGGIQLAVDQTTSNVWTLAPSLEVGTEIVAPGLGLLRPYIKGGVTVRDRTSFSTSASFVGNSYAPFVTTTTMDRVVTDVGAGLDVICPFDSVLRLQYDSSFSPMITQYMGSAKLSLKY